MAKVSKKTAAKKGRTISVDMTDVEGASRMEDGDYVAKVVEVTQEESQEGNDYLKWKLKTTDGKTLYHNTSLQPQALWNLRNTLEALGLEVPQKSIDVDLDDLVDLELGVSVENEIYQGKKKPRVVDVFSTKEVEAVEEGEEEDEEEPEEKPAKSAKKSKAKPEPEEEEEEEETEEPEEEGDELDGLDRNALKKKLAELETDFIVKKSTTDDEIRGAIRAASGEEEAEEPEEEEAEEEQEEEAPKPKKKGGGTKYAVGDKVSFEDEGKKLSGSVTKVNDKEGFCEVKVKNELWEIEWKDLSKS